MLQHPQYGLQQTNLFICFASLSLSFFFSFFLSSILFLADYFYCCYSFYDYCFFFDPARSFSHVSRSSLVNPPNPIEV